jgi:hypothetical protein
VPDDIIESYADPVESLEEGDPVESLTDTEIDESTLPYTLETDIDPVDVMVRFIQRLIQRPSKKFPITPDRDRLIVTVLLAIISDPNHYLNRIVTNPLMKVYLERGGRVYRAGPIARNMREDDQFDHTVQYLYDYGIPIPDIARALSVGRRAVAKRIKYRRTEDIETFENDT